MRSKALLFVILLCLGVPASASAEDAAQRAPNIVFIMADDLGWGDLGSYGQKIIRTPRLDGLAEEGMRFTSHYAGSPVCAPSRAVLLTGKHGGHAFIRDNKEVQPEGQWPLAAEEVTIAELLKERGYATAAIGKWGLGMFDSEGSPLRQGFDRFYGYNCQRHAHNHYPRYLWDDDRRVELPGNTRSLTGEHYTQDLFIERAQAFVRDHADEPFFLYLALAVPHVSVQVSEASLAEYEGRIPESPFEQRDGYEVHPSPRAGYAAMVTHMDRGVGALLDVIAELGLEEETIVIFTSDNGPAAGRAGGSDSGFFDSNGPWRGLKGSVREGGLRVPLIVRWPGKVASGTRSDLPTVFYDWMPTLLDLAGAPAAPPARTDGISFAPTLLGNPDQQQEHAFLYWEFSGYGGQQAVRAGRWKGVRTDLHKGNDRWSLYDLSRDPGEEHDVSQEHPEVMERIRRIASREHDPSELFPIRVLDE